MSEPFPYEDIVNLPHPISKKHAPMSMIDRAAQFSPFAALTGYEDAIEETARLTDARPELGEEQANELDRRLSFLKEHLENEPEITVTRFQPDTRKAGGTILSVTGKIHMVDLIHRQLIFTDYTALPLSDVLRLDGEIFRQSDEIQS